MAQIDSYGMHPMKYRNPPGRSEIFLNIEVRTNDKIVTVDPVLDKKGRKKLREVTNGRKFIVTGGIATIAWRDESSRAACIFDHQKNAKRKNRWKDVQEYAVRMKADEFPSHGHVYVAGATDSSDSLIVIDGTRRTLAYLEAGLHQMPVVVVIFSDAD